AVARAGVDLPDRERATEPRTDLGREEGAEALDLRLAGGRLGDDAGAQGHAELAQHGLSAAASRAARAAARATWSACPRGCGRRSAASRPAARPRPGRAPCSAPSCR